MGVYGRDGDPKAAADALATAYRPRQAVLTDPSAGGTDVVVVNDTPESVSGSLTWEAGDESGEAEVDVPADGRVVIDSISLPAGTDAVTLALTAGGETVRTEYRL